ncbi:cytochrome C oxidase subunit IV family protein [Paracoccus sp. (in: a-proteobacteria)]|uniref:cytochrome C oxidase subunit IV family protein n=1 Tax=Paracoccus sp. TaxID=267 RepID=UPI0026DFEC6E|nr:cytochrome C oxidase subunit IV family protein [Paracoccus sp. (in: a-proteobacteria)]MDO5647867.1 cytochrome C oxidase subunit IV family protein [Paracoccus sp. (in: a-proteobacteria)]
MTNPLIRAWLILIGASGAATVAALSPLPPGAQMVVILICAWIKARVVLGAYLELDHAPAMRRGFDIGLALFLLLAAALWSAA